MPYQPSSLVRDYQEEYASIEVRWEPIANGKPWADLSNLEFNNSDPAPTVSGKAL
ncbi:MAG: hypothetical protein ACT4OL_11195 [Nitrospiraceae bacterium]